MPDFKIAFRYGTAGLSTVYAVLRAADGSNNIVSSSDGTVLLSLSSGSWPSAVILMGDSSTYYYTASPPAGLPSENYPMEIYLASAPSIYAIGDPLIGEGTFKWRGPAGTSPSPGSGMAALRTYITTALGASSLDVELAEGDLNQCISDAILQLNRWHPPMGWGIITFTASQVMYTLTIPGLYGLISVDAVRNVFANFASLNAFPLGIYPGFNLAYAPLVSPGDVYGDIAMQLQYVKTAKYITGNDFDWNQRRVAIGTVQLFVIADPGASVQFQYVWHLTPDDDTNTGVGLIPDPDLDWVQRFSTAKAKQILGRVRGKYGGVNMPDGSVEQLDGASMLAEGREDEARLLLELKARRRNIEPQKG